MNLFKVRYFDDEETRLTLYVIAETPSRAAELANESIEGQGWWCEYEVIEYALPKGEGVCSRTATLLLGEINQQEN